MKYFFNEKPRNFELKSKGNKIVFSDFGEIQLDNNELITLVNTEGKRHDIVAKEWGYYITPSINKRAVDQGYKTALVKNKDGRFYIMVLEHEKMDIFNNYLNESNQILVEFLDEKEM